MTGVGMAEAMEMAVMVMEKVAQVMVGKVVEMALE